jgi:hypothetical protein
VRLWVGLLFSLFPGPAWAGGENPLLFPGPRAYSASEVQPSPVEGQVVWESGDSKPTEEPFDKVLVQGRLTHPGARLEASVRGWFGWSRWKAASIERFPNGRFWGLIPVGGPRASKVRMRLVHQGMPKGSRFEFFSSEAVLEEPETPEPEHPAPPAPPSVPKPEVAGREQWGAEPPHEAYTPMAPERVTVHHTAAAQPLTLEDAIIEMRAIQRYHQKGRGWNDIAYHFLIDGSGRIFQGRPENAQGAHTLGHNAGNVGISIMGDFHPPRSMQPTPAQLASLVKLLKWVQGGLSVPLTTLKGHRDYRSTDCPGDFLYAKLEDLRRQAEGSARAAKLKLPEIAHRSP